MSSQGTEERFKLDSLLNKVDYGKKFISWRTLYLLCMGEVTNPS